MSNFQTSNELALLWAKVDDYICELMVPQDVALTKAIETSKQMNLPPISISANQGKFLQLLAQIQGAKSILEIGTLGGYSAIWLARALSTNGKLTTLELDAHHANVAQTNIDFAGLTDRISIRLGNALQSLHELSQENIDPFDMIFIDADKANYPKYLEWSIQLSRSGGLIVVDNVVRNGQIINFNDNDEAVIGTREMNKLIAFDARISATEIQTVGSKGYDGFALIRVL